MHGMIRHNFRQAALPLFNDDVQVHRLEFLRAPSNLLLIHIQSEVNIYHQPVVCIANLLSGKA